MKLNIFEVRQLRDECDKVIKWYDETKSADWKNFTELRKTFNTADHVGNDRYVFDVKGNQYRLIALIIFKVRTVFILFIGTHKEYDEVNASKVSF
jgi:mRNA interferase HigB